VITRRMALGTGLAIATAVSSGAYGAVVTGRRNIPKVNALLVDRTIKMPDQIEALIAASARTLPVIRVDLDAAAHAGLMRVLGDSEAIVGVSSGATLFCLERLAWDHGFRLTQRRSTPVIEARWQDAASLLSGHVSSGTRASPIPGYAPSRADGLLHSWLIQRPDSARSRRGGGVRS
jgi:hypothetical protein